MDNPIQNDLVQRLMSAVENGIQRIGGLYRFIDPGIALVPLRVLPAIQNGPIVVFRDRYDERDWIRQEAAPQERVLHLPVSDSFNKDFDDQKILLERDEEVSSARILVSFLVVYWFVEKKRFLPSYSFRTCDTDAQGRNIIISEDRDRITIDATSRRDFPHVCIAAEKKS